MSKARNQALASFWRGLETIDGKAEALGRYEVLHGDYRSCSGAEGVRGITAEDVRAVATDVLRRSNRTVGLLESPAAAGFERRCDDRGRHERVAAAGWALVIAAVAVATFVCAIGHRRRTLARGVKLPVFERVTLANGTQVARSKDTTRRSCRSPP